MEFFSGVMVGLIVGVAIMCFLSIIEDEDLVIEEDLEEINNDEKRV